MTKYIMFLAMGHVLGDFYFQTEKISSNKEKRYSWVLLHSLEYAIAVVLTAVCLFNYNIDVIYACLAVALCHCVIDSSKFILVKTRKVKNEWNIFLSDQVMHIISIIVLANVFYTWNFVVDLGGISTYLTGFSIDLIYCAKWVLVLLILHKPCNILVAKFLSQYRPFSPAQSVYGIIETKNAGRVIGTIERIIMIILIAISQYSALGLVLTAKSITRYDKISKDEGFAEYYLLGTLMSLLCVLVTSLLFKI